MRALGEEGYRARQIFQGIYKQGQSDCSQFTNLPLRLREKLNHRFVIKLLERQEEYLSADGTIKYVFKLSDGNYIETVVIPSGVRQTVCLSTQVGCKFRCAFCASGLKGFKRNLSAGEIVSQVLILKHQLNHQINNLVFMGMGEPLDNLHEVIKAIRILNDKQGMDIGARRITVSTAGIVPGIKKLKDLNLQINLSISIHSPFDRQRTELMPINQKYPLAELAAAAEDYLKGSGRQLTLEYILIKNFNDRLYEAEGLAAIARRLKAKVNLIAYSPVSNLPYVRPGQEEMQRFQKWLEERKVRTTVRKSKGLDITAACGQLTGRLK